MNKTLLLMRHGEAGNAARDFDRPLTEQGAKKSRAQGALLTEQGIQLSMLVTSPALRAFSSALAVAEAMHYPETKIMTDEALYNAPADVLFNAIQGFEDSWHTVLLIAHNPGISALARSFNSTISSDLDVSDFCMLSFPVLHWQDLRP